MTAIVVILIALIIAAALGIWMTDYARYNSGFVGFVGIILLIATGISALMYAHVVWSWLASESKAQIINREYGTNYTREEIFYASSVIETIRELDRKRFEVNGDLMREEPDSTP